MSEVKRYSPGYRDNYGDGGFEDCKECADGELVSYKDYAGLKEQFDFKRNLTEQVVALQNQYDALAAENVAQASSLKALATLNNRLWQWTSRMSYNASYVGEPEGLVKGHIREMEKILDATGKDTPATDAYLNFVRAEGVEILTGKLQQLIDEGVFDAKEIGVAAGAVHEGAQIADQLRAGKDGE